MLIHDVPTRKFLPTLPRSEPLIKDHTAVKEFMTCKRKYFYRMVLGRTAKKTDLSSIFAWGSAVHKFAELYSVNYDLQEATAAAYPIFQKPVAGKPAWEHLDLDRFMLTLNALRVFFDDERKAGYVKTLATEAPFNLELPDGNQIGGRMDAIIKYGGQTWVRDYKTTTKPINYFIPRLDPNDQATRYVYGMSRMMGWDSVNQQSAAKAYGIEFFIIQNLRPTESEKKKPVIERKNITKSHEQLVMFEREQMFIHRMMDMCREADEWPMEPTNCQWCDYAQVCRAATDASRVDRLKTQFLHEPWDHQKVEQEPG